MKIQKNVDKRKELSFLSIAHIVKKYRRKSSYFFIIYWAWIRAPRKPKSHLLADKKLESIGLNAPAMRQLSGIYQGLQREIGHIQAVTACLEIARGRKVMNENRKTGNSYLK